MPEDRQPCLLVDAVLHSVDGRAKLECLLVHVADAMPEQKDKYRSQFLTLLDWITFSLGIPSFWLDYSEKIRNYYTHCIVNFEEVFLTRC